MVPSVTGPKRGAADKRISMLSDRLDKAWDRRRATTNVDAIMRFSNDGLVFGAGTLLAPTRDLAHEVSTNPSGPRLVALLAAAHLGTPTTGALNHLRRAAECWGEGEDALASMHLVLSQVDRLRDPDVDAHRMF